MSPLPIRRLAPKAQAELRSCQKMCALFRAEMTSNADLLTSGIALVECPDTPASDRNFQIVGDTEVISGLGVFPGSSLLGRNAEVLS